MKYSEETITENIFNVGWKVIAVDGGVKLEFTKPVTWVYFYTQEFREFVKALGHSE